MATAAGGDPAASGRYEYLLQQVVQLNTDLHKTVAMSQSLKAERDGLKEMSGKLKQELQRCEEKCEKMHTLLMTETEYKVQSDRKHEQLVYKWKQQLEAKAKEFETLQKNLAPPKDLDQLRMKIQEEVELPHRQRVQGLQMDIEKFRDMFFHARRDYEILKTEHEQILINHGNEIESMQATHLILLQDLKRKLDVAEEKAEDMTMVERVRKMEQDRDTIVLENQKLRVELEQLRAAKNDLYHASEVQITKLQASIADITLHRTNSDLELKSASRVIQRQKDDLDKLLKEKDDVEKKLRDERDDTLRLREQLKQKELALSENQVLYNTKVRELRYEIEQEKQQFKEKQVEYNEQIVHLQQAHDQIEAMFAKREKEWQIESVRLQAMNSNDSINLKEMSIQLENKLSEKSMELAKVQEDFETRWQKLHTELEQEQFKFQRLQGEKDSLQVKLTTTQELVVTKLKAETLTWRAQHKEMEQEYRSLQAKHRDAMQLQQENQSYVDQLKAKIDFLEEDIAQLNNKLTTEKACHAQAQQQLQSQLDESISAALAARRSLQHDLKSNVSKLTHSLSKAEKKRDAYKQKCLEVHERYKKAKSERDTLMIEVQQLKDAHQSEIQHLLQQWAIGEQEKTQQLLGSSLLQPDLKLESFLAQVDQYSQEHKSSQSQQIHNVSSC